MQQVDASGAQPHARSEHREPARRQGVRRQSPARARRAARRTSSSAARTRSPATTSRCSSSTACRSRTRLAAATDRRRPASAARLRQRDQRHEPRRHRVDHGAQGTERGRALRVARASNGVIVITTKKGAASKGRDGAPSSRRTTRATRRRCCPTTRTSTARAPAASSSSWTAPAAASTTAPTRAGARKLDGRLIDQFTGAAAAVGRAPGQREGLLQDRPHALDNLAVPRRHRPRERAPVARRARTSRGIIPNNCSRRSRRCSSGTMQVSAEVHAPTRRCSTSSNNGHNRPGAGYNTGILEQFIWFGRQVDMDALSAQARPTRTATCSTGTTTTTTTRTGSSTRIRSRDERDRFDRRRLGALHSLAAGSTRTCAPARTLPVQHRPALRQRAT